MGPQKSHSRRRGLTGVVMPPAFQYSMMAPLQAMPQLKGGKEHKSQSELMAIVAPFPGVIGRKRDNELVGFWNITQLKQISSQNAPYLPRLQAAFEESTKLRSANWV
ncbi:hypothetical protein EmuJ_001109100 [Echinococcus multilocularis]|uniref:Uncharacterized protein n=1 Tax=Echinococcus multilocularis TaxID=6211 RepID=A0A068YJ75_ECHMU|nr:hypothetical protein EmuJ_001109100 [Echinococcus multilocularis]